MEYAKQSEKEINYFAGTTKDEVNQLTEPWILGEDAFHTERRHSMHITLVAAAKIAMMLGHKALELHDAGVDQKVIDEIHEIYQKAHDIVDRHYVRHQEDTAFEAKG